MVTEGGHIHQGKHGEVLKKLGREATTGRGSWPAMSTVCVCSSGGRGALESFPHFVGQMLSLPFYRGGN